VNGNHRGAELACGLDTGCDRVRYLVKLEVENYLLADADEVPDQGRSRLDQQLKTDLVAGRILTQPRHEGEGLRFRLEVERDDH